MLAYDEKICGGNLQGSAKGEGIEYELSQSLMEIFFSIQNQIEKLNYSDFSKALVTDFLPFYIGDNQPDIIQKSIMGTKPRKREQKEIRKVSTELPESLVHQNHWQPIRFPCDLKVLKPTQRKSQTF